MAQHMMTRMHLFLSAILTCSVCAALATPPEQDGAKTSDVEQASSPAETAEPARPSLDAGEAFLPVKLGMTRGEVSELFPNAERTLLLVHPSDLAAGFNVPSIDGSSFQVAFDEDEHVKCVFTSREDAELSNGVRLGMTFAEVKERCPDCEVFKWPGYGTIVVVSETEWAVFGYMTDPPLPHQPTVSWLELRNTDAKGWSTSVLDNWSSTEEGAPACSPNPPTRRKTLADWLALQSDDPLPPLLGPVFAQIGEAFLPLKLGMTREQILELDRDAKEYRLLLTPNEDLDGYNPVSANDKHFTVALDKRGGVCCIMTAFEGAELSNGTTPGMTFAEVKRRCPDCEVMDWPGYGTIVKVSKWEWAVFGTPNAPPDTDSLVVEWLELRATNWLGCLYFEERAFAEFEVHSPFDASWVGWNLMRPSWSAEDDADDSGY